MFGIENHIDQYYLRIIMFIGINIIMALGLNLITGLTGQLSLGHAAFMSIGAYTSAILTLKMGYPYPLALLCGALMAAFFGIVIGFPSLRLSGDYLAIATLGFAEIVKVLLLNMNITGGALGLSPIAADTTLSTVFLLVVITIWIMYRLENSRFGRGLKAIREDEIAAESMGINTTSYKIQAFAIGSFFAGLGGGLYAHYIQFISPNDFGFLKSVDLLSMLVLGGMGSISGTIIGATVLTAAPEMLRFVQQYRMLIYGALLVVMMIFRPNGLLGGVDITKIFKKTFGIKDKKTQKVKGEAK